MDYIALSLLEIEDILTQKNIPFDTVGFYDHENFINEENKDPKFLEIYAAYVNKRHYSDQYLIDAKRIIHQVGDLFAASVAMNGRLGACVDVSSVVSRVLDKLGVWNCVIKGGLTISYPSSANLAPTYFWAYDQANFAAPHAWVFAPPFNVLDLTVKYQKYDKDQSKYLPDYILESTEKKAVPLIMDIYNPSMISQIHIHDVSKHFKGVTKFQKIIYSTEYDKNGVGLKYIPLAVGCSDVPLEKINNMKFEDLYPYEFFEKNIMGTVGSAINI